MKNLALGLIIIYFSSNFAVAATKIVDGVEVRDWEAIDTNQDNNISPEEMQRFLEAVWAKSGESKTSDKDKK